MDSFLNDSKNQSLYPTSSTSSGEICTSVAMKFNDATVIVSVIILGIINIIVIAGNILVIVSVFVSAKLRTVTNFFIVSLAVADLLVGIAVLPYSLTLEILDVWVFGEIWCQGWLATDVWMCTASILNLCAISVDRYLAVTRPVRYRSIMTSKRAKIIIACVWVLSFIICFPPLVGWNDETTSFMAKNKFDLHSVTHPYPTALSKQSEQTSGSTILLNVSSVGVIESTRPSISLGIPETNNINNNNNNNHIVNDYNNSHNKYNNNRSHHFEHNAHTCEYNSIQCSLFNNKGYVIYSALGSFYIPMFVMIFFYWRIYLVASRTSRALKRGYKTTKCNGSHDERLTLRIHRGYLVDEIQACGNTSTSSYLSTHCNDSNTLNTTTFTSTSTSPKSRSSNLKQQTLIESQNSDQKQSTNKGKRGTAQECKQSSSGSSGTAAGSAVGKRQMPITLYRSSRLTATLSPNNIEQNGGNRRMSPSSQSNLSLPSSSSPSSSREGSAKSGKLAMTRFSKRTSKYQAKRFHAETKAAKTVGIIVGGFILCWLPFFTVYLARAFCVKEDCIPQLLFSIFIWLGYCNSLLNPCIYGLFSKDFRRAFKNIICRCKFREETVSSLIRQIHMPTFFEDMPEDMMKPESQED